MTDNKKELKKQKAKIEKSLKVLQEFSRANEMKSLKKELWTFLETTICTDRLGSHTEIERANLFYTYSQMIKVSKAINVLFPCFAEPLLILKPENIPGQVTDKP